MSGQSCRSCAHFDLEAARLGGVNVKRFAAVRCMVDPATLKWPNLDSLPHAYKPPRKPPENLTTCADYGQDCDFYTKRPKPPKPTEDKP